MDEELTAKSLKHAGYWCVPLPSGRIAVWYHPLSELVGIFPDWPAVAALPMQGAPCIPPPPVEPLPDLDLEDFI